MFHVRKEVSTDSVERLSTLLGNFDENLNYIARELHLTAYVDGLNVCLEGNEADVEQGVQAVRALLSLAGTEGVLDESRVAYCVELAKEGRAEEVGELTGDTIAVTARGRQIRCKTVGQKRYVQAMKKHPVVFGVGPAGTGKTYLAVCMAVSAYKMRTVDKIVLTRPAVEAGEKLGFLPGDLQTKVDPYLRPLYDALQELLGLETYARLMERGAIEVAPLAYMRGRTLSNAFILLDEAQNATKEQMKMFLTRMGEGSKIVVTGDVTQIDLPEGKQSGLVHACEVLDGVEGVAVCPLTDKDVVRHPMVMRIVRAYERAERKNQTPKTEKKPRKNATKKGGNE